ncbi:MAG: hypothetical protein GX222_03565 [Ruminococcaceae bacterium]|nr:hypothetical protein [Oscillospiraceae bacterium]
MFKKLKRIIVVTGHYGCGKTNLSVNLALYFSDLGEKVTIIDLDIVNPYFRTADFKDALLDENIKVLEPNFANTLLDIPSLPREVSGALSSMERVIIDLGGDDAGAGVLGRYEREIEKAGGADMLYLFSIFRPGTQDANEVAEHISFIEKASKQKVKYLVNSSNLGSETSREDVVKSMDFANEVESVSGIPLIATVALESFSEDIEGSFAVKRFVKLPWE